MNRLEDISNLKTNVNTNNLDIKNWRASDDTLLIMATIKALNNGATELDFIKQYIEIYDELVKEERVSGYQTLKSIDFLKKITKSEKRDSYLEMISYDKHMGDGNEDGNVVVIDNEKELLSSEIWQEAATNSLRLRNTDEVF